MIYVPVYIAVDTDSAVEAIQAAQVVCENTEGESFSMAVFPPEGLPVIQVPVS